MDQLRSAVDEIIAQQAVATGIVVHTAALFDFDGTLYHHDGSFDSRLPAALEHARRNGVLLVAATDNPCGGISAWLRYLGVAPDLMSIRVHDYGARICAGLSIVNVVDTTEMLRAFAVITAGVQAFCVRQGYEVVMAHPSEPNGRSGVVLDRYRQIGFSAEVHNNGLTQNITRAVGAEFQRLAAENGRIHGKVFAGVDSERGLMFMPPWEVCKADGVARLVEALPLHLRITHIGDSAWGERGVVDIPRLECYAPRGTSQARTPGVTELATAAHEGAVVELINDHLLR
jgi:hydroxymethylpyrimidine pyrophosphatase-like HAD family hydrolase